MGTASRHKNDSGAADRGETRSRLVACAKQGAIWNGRTRAVSWLALLAILSVAGCTHVQSTAGVPARNATPLEQALAYNDALAQANKSVAQAVINANATVPPLLAPDQANRILATQARIADLDRQLTPLLASTSTVSANAASIQSLLDQIKAAAQGLVQSGDLGIKDAKTQQSVLATFNSVYSFADLAVTTLKGAGLLP